MDAPERAPLCANQIHVTGGDRIPEPTNLCSCEAGLVHMHDCPMTVGLECVHFRAAEGEPTTMPMPEQEEMRLQLMQDYLSRDYFHRLRLLSPEGDSWQRLREELAARQAESLLGEDAAEVEPEESEEQVARADASYEREKERLLDQRRKREERRLEQEARNRDQLAQERARRGIKTVVEKAQETVAAQGNVVVSYLDKIDLPAGEPDDKKRRRRSRRKGRKPGEGGAESPARQTGGEGGEGGDRPRRSRRKRGGGKGAGGKGAGGKSAGGQAPAKAEGAKPAAKEGERPARRRRRRRGRGKSGGGASGGGAAPA